MAVPFILQVPLLVRKRKWKIKLRETDALLFVDVQSTFMPGGGLAVANGDAIVPVCRSLMCLFPKERRYATKDRHRRGSISLASSYNWKMTPFTILTYNMVKDWQDSEERLADHARFTLLELKDYLSKVGFQVLWPDHGLDGTQEAELHPEFSEDEFTHVEVKGMDDACDSYSGFRDNRGRCTGLKRKMRRQHRAKPLRRLFIVGLAFNFCVAYTAMNAAKEGFEVYIVLDGTRPVAPEHAPPGHDKDILRRIKDISKKTKKKIHFIYSDDLVAA